MTTVPPILRALFIETSLPRVILLSFANISFTFNSLLICTLPDTSKFASAKEMSLLITAC